jgi:hypothetical protein
MSLVRLILLRLLFKVAFKLLDAEERAQGISLRPTRGRRQ